MSRRLNRMRCLLLSKISHCIFITVVFLPDFPYHSCITKNKDKCPKSKSELRFTFYSRVDFKKWPQIPTRARTQGDISQTHPKDWQCCRNSQVDPGWRFLSSQIISFIFSSIHYIISRIGVQVIGFLVRKVILVISDLVWSFIRGVLHISYRVHF